MYIVFDHVYPISMHQPQAELGGRNENSVEVCRSHFKRDGNAGVWGAWGAHLRIFLCTMHICPFDNCTRKICLLAPISQRKVTFQSNIFWYYFPSEAKSEHLRLLPIWELQPDEMKLSYNFKTYHNKAGSSKASNNKVCHCDHFLAELPCPALGRRDWWWWWWLFLSQRIF